MICHPRNSNQSFRLMIVYKKIIVSNVLLLLSTTLLLAQKNFTISGTIKDKKNGESMIGVTVFPLELSAVGTACNEYGFYSLTLPEGKYHIVCSFVGYKSDTVFINLNANIKSDRFLSDDAVFLNEITIEAEKKDDNIKRTDIGVEKVDVKETSKIP